MMQSAAGNHGRSVMLIATILFGLGQTAGASAAEKPRAADRAFVVWAVQIEIQQQDMGKLAERRAQTAAVRHFGTYLVGQFGDAQRKLEPIAGRLKLRLAHNLAPVHLKIQKRFASIPSGAFDHAFLRHEIGDYRYFLSHFEIAAKSPSALMRTYATMIISQLKDGQLKLLALLAQ